MSSFFAFRLPSSQSWGTGTSRTSLERLERRTLFQFDVYLGSVNGAGSYQPGDELSGSVFLKVLNGNPGNNKASIRIFLVPDSASDDHKITLGSFEAPLNFDKHYSFVIPRDAPIGHYSLNAAMTVSGDSDHSNNAAVGGPVTIFKGIWASPTITGTSGRDVIYISRGSGRVVTMNGISRRVPKGTFLVDAGGGDDTIITDYGAAAVAITGAGGNDTILGGNADDELSGGSGKDRIIGGSGKDYLLGGAGADYLDGDADNDTLSGAGGNDRLFDDMGNDCLLGGSGNDLLDGRDGQFDSEFIGDTLSGGAGKDSALCDRDDAQRSIQVLLS
jgi:Ca2+-binding RTX toxin-like protein